MFANFDKKYLWATTGFARISIAIENGIDRSRLAETNRR